MQLAPDLTEKIKLKKKKIGWLREVNVKTDNIIETLYKMRAMIFHS